MVGRRRPSERVRRNRRRAWALLVGFVALVAVAGVGWSTRGPGRHGSTRLARSSHGGASASLSGAGETQLAVGSRPEVLPGPVLIADEGNDRLVVVDPHGRVTWVFPRPGDLPAGVEFKSPDDAFFTPDGKQIIATEEEFSVVTLIDIASRRIVWRYGTPGTPGSGANQLSNPDDAIVLAGGHVLMADIKNCRLLLIAPGSHVPERIYGTTTRDCRHDPPRHFGSPNGAFPMANGHYLVTEINGNWVDEMDLAGHVWSSTHPPGVSYPSDTNEVRPGTYLTVDYSDPGLIETFDPSGRLLWRYRPPGADALDHPSLALALPNGNVIATDDHNDRVIVVDPHTNQVVWQYGVRGRAGDAPGLLNGPDGLDLAPPNSELRVKTTSMGELR